MSPFPSARDLLAANGLVWSLGQLSRADKLWLATEVRAGRLTMRIAWWPYFSTGTCRKTVWTPKI